MLRGVLREDLVAMGVPEFKRKFEIVARALARAERRIVHKWIAHVVFAEVETHSAEVKWCDCTKGRRVFPQAKIGALLADINNQTDGFLISIESDIFLKSIGEFENAFVSAGLLDAPAREVQPLSELLAELAGPSEVWELLGKFRPNRETTNEFELAFHLLPGDKRIIVAGWFCEVLDQVNWFSRKDVSVGSIVGCVLFRIWPWLADVPKMRQVSSQLETTVRNHSPEMVFLSDPIASIASLLGAHGSFRAHVERLVNDPQWRRIDCQRHLRYHHGFKGTAHSIKSHLLYPTGNGQVACEDIGTLISIYPELVKEPELTDLAVFLKDRMLGALKHADARPSTRRRAEVLLRGRID